MTKQALDTMIDLARSMRGQKFHTVLADPPWRFQNRTGKMAPEHRRLSRYETLTSDEISAMPVAEAVTTCRPSQLNVAVDKERPFRTLTVSPFSTFQMRASPSEDAVTA